MKAKQVLACGLLAVTLLLLLAACPAEPDRTDSNSELEFELINDGSSNDGTYRVRAADGGVSGVVIIPATHNDLPVTEVANYAFAACTSLTEITIPASITSIGDRAFVDCSNLTAIIIPANITSIGSSAFCDWTSSQTIYIEGHASQEAADAAWSPGFSASDENHWRYGCDAVIRYWDGSSWE